MIFNLFVILISLNAINCIPKPQAPEASNPIFLQFKAFGTDFVKGFETFAAEDSALLKKLNDNPKLDSLPEVSRFKDLLGKIIPIDKQVAQLIVTYPFIGSTGDSAKNKNTVASIISDFMRDVKKTEVRATFGDYQDAFKNGFNTALNTNKWQQLADIVEKSLSTFRESASLVASTNASSTKAIIDNKNIITPAVRDVIKKDFDRIVATDANITKVLKGLIVELSKL